MHVPGSGQLVRVRGLGAQVLRPESGVQPVGTDSLLSLSAGRWRELPKAATGGHGTALGGPSCIRSSALSPPGVLAAQEPRVRTDILPQEWGSLWLLG